MLDDKESPALVSHTCLYLYELSLVTQPTYQYLNPLEAGCDRLRTVSYVLVNLRDHVYRT